MGSKWTIPYALYKAEDFRANGGAVGGQFAGAPLLLLHTVGAGSGQRRVNPVMYQEVDGGYAVFASKAGDLPRARAAFERGLGIADEAGLGVWRLRALHELATIELLDEAGTGRLLEARRSAEALGALSTAATLALQLAAVSLLRFELDEGARYARAALALSERLGLDRARVMGLWFLAENYALRRERGESERLLALAQAAAPATGGRSWGQRTCRVHCGARRHGTGRS